MIKKLIILFLVILALSIFYKKFMRGSIEPFLKQDPKKLDLLQQIVPGLNK